MLTDVKVRNAKPREKAYKLADSGGLHLLVSEAGGRLWRLSYRFGGCSFAKGPARSHGSDERQGTSAGP